MRLPRFRLAAPLVFFLGLFVHYGHSSHSSINSISFLTKIPLALAFLAKDISAARVWVPNVPAGIASMEERDGSIKDEYYEISNTFAKPGSKIVQEEEVISDQPYPWISLDEEWRLAHLQSPYVLRKKKGSSKKSVSSKKSKSSSSDEFADDIETEDGDEQTATSSSDEVEDEEVPIASSGEAEEEEEFEQVPDEDNEEEQDDVVPREYLNNEESGDYSESTGPPIPLPPPQNDESEENAADSDEEDEESEDDDNSSSVSKVPLQALSHTGVEDEDDSTETNLELIPDEVKEAIVREMAKQYAQQARISATQIKKKVTTSKPSHIYYVKEDNKPEVFTVTDPRLTKSQPVHHDSPSKRVTNSDGPFTEHGGGKGKGKSKGKGKGKGQGHGWRPPPKIWHPPPPQHHEPHKHVRDGLLEQWTKGSQWERIIHSYHDYKDKQHYEQKHGKDPHGGAGPLHKKPGIGESLFKGSFWERAFVTYANYKKKQQNKGAHEMAGEGWAPYDR